MQDDADAIHEYGRNAHRKEVSAGIYVVSEDGSRLNFLQKHVPMKPGWRNATADDIARFVDAEARRRPAELAELTAAIAAERQRCHEAGELERADAKVQAERAEAKRAKNNVKKFIAVPDDFDPDKVDEADAGDDQAPGEVMEAMIDARLHELAAEQDQLQQEREAEEAAAAAAKKDDSDTPS